ncbi:hypothetical protein GCM10023149_42790 [Mucilaginibacter gynuensis]|uniref:SnoaL-like domain-containing protein n=1 Tax=Mucilaginibacter gynuensis TaxID=1302236 RepID=A0ABP8H6B8_9SPHI
MKNLSLILIAMLMLSACRKFENSAQNIAIAEGMFEAFNQHDWKKMAAFYADTAEFLDPSFGTEYVKKTPAETASKYKEMQQMFPDIKDDVKSITATGDRVVVEFVSGGSLPDGKKWRLPICTVLTITKGKIVKDATYYDNSH